jgi:hypothetical protein
MTEYFHPTPAGVGVRQPDVEADAICSGRDVQQRVRLGNAACRGGRLALNEEPVT